MPLISLFEKSAKFFNPSKIFLIKSSSFSLEISFNRFFLNSNHKLKIKLNETEIFLIFGQTILTLFLSHQVC